MRVEAQRRLLAELDAELAGLPNRALPEEEPKKIFDALRRWEARRQEIDARARRLEAMDVVLRGGYNEFLSVPQTLPIFASINLGFVPGWFWQGAAEERSAAGRRDWVESRIERVRASFRESSTRLSHQLDVARREQRELLIGLSDLEQRYANLKDVDTTSARELKDYLWFDLVKLRAERAHAEARVQTLERQRRALEDSLR